MGTSKSKATRSYHLTSVRMLLSKGQKLASAGDNMKKKGISHIPLVGMQISTASVENSPKFLKNIVIDLTSDPAIPLLGIYLKYIISAY